MIKYLWKIVFGDSCKHQWKIIVKDTIPSSYTCHQSATVYPYYKTVVLLNCSNCGKIERKSL